MSIPKIIHQIWIGPKPRPAKLMATFRDKHPDFEYILWTEEEMVRRGFKLENQTAYDSMEQWCGKADILRWEILYQYGGIYQDADSICLEQFDDILLSTPAFAAYENEVSRKGLVAVGTMGFPKGHPLCRAAIDYIATHEVSLKTTGNQAWATTGPGLLTRLVNTGKYPDFTIFPSYYFIPQHFTGVQYMGHAKVYCYQIWGTTVVGYDTIEDTVVPQELLDPPKELWVSVIVASYNPNLSYILDTLESIRNQTGYFGIELIWIDDASDPLHSIETVGYNKTSLSIEDILNQFQKTTRFTRVVYHKNSERLGINASLKIGLGLSTCNTIITPNEAMAPDYIYKRIGGMKMPRQFTTETPNVVSLRSFSTAFSESSKSQPHPF